MNWVSVLTPVILALIQAAEKAFEAKQGADKKAAVVQHTQAVAEHLVSVKAMDLVPTQNELSPVVEDLLGKLKDSDWDGGKVLEPNPGIKTGSNGNLITGDLDLTNRPKREGAVFHG